MKYRVLITVVIIMLLLGINVSAEGYEYTISPGENFTAAKSDDDLTLLSQKLDTTPEQLSTYYQQNGIIYFAISDVDKAQIKISVTTDDFSSKVTDISKLDDQALSEFAKLFGETEIVVNNDRKYICTTNTKTVDDANFTVTQYVTICNQKIFYFTAYNEGNDTSAIIANAFQSFKLCEKTSQSPDAPNYMLQIVLTIIGATIFAAVAVVMIIKIVKGIKNED